jgi:CDP-paratose 2-epimerase
VNALGTLNLLEATRQHCPQAVFLFMSTNKVYGDAPNEVPLKELPTRWDYARPEDFSGISEHCRIDRTLHSLFGASKASADLVAQEYGRYFKMNVGIFRGGCLTGPSHSGVELHGFLSYLVKVTITGGKYSVFGYKGKQVRDNIHSHDVVRAIEEFASNPRPGEVYNIGGGRENSISMLEAISRIEPLTGKKLNWTYVDEARKGDHICYISDLTKFKSHYPNWRVTKPLDDILEEIITAESSRTTASPTASR